MMYQIRKEPDPILREKAKEIVKSELGSPRLLKMAKDMVAAMKEAKGVGLAAPQIGVSERLIVVAPPDEEPIAVVNPEIAKRSLTSGLSEEGCLSVPGVWGFVKRANSVTVKGFSPTGEKFQRKFSGFTATIFQHEIDHLNGILFIDKATNLSKLGVAKI